MDFRFRTRATTLWIFSLLLGACLTLAHPAGAQPSHAKGGDRHDDADGRDDNGKGKGKGRQKAEEARPDGKGRAGDDRRDHPARAERGRPEAAPVRHFEDRQRTIVREYYVTEYRSGHCPPGLAKKHNGCMPPGQAKKWRVGQPLPREVIYYEVPQPLVVRLGPPPPGYRYVRVAADILMIAVGTGLVIDAIADLGNL
jgi:Ni/Co efflux regulator RcnB